MNPFQANIPILFLVNRFHGVFKGYKMRALARNELSKSTVSTSFVKRDLEGNICNQMFFTGICDDICLVIDILLSVRQKHK